MVVHEDVRLERSLKEIWDQTLEILSKDISKAKFNMMILPLHLLDVTEDEAVIGVNNTFMQGVVKKEHQGALERALTQVVKRPLRANITVDTSLTSNEYTGSIASITVVPETPYLAESEISVSPTPRNGQAVSGGLASANLNLKYTFDSFVVGSHNRFCYSAARAVADKPGQAYSPLFIYGGVGLGKTHLMQAIGHQIVMNSPNLVVRYLSGEKFTNELINCLMNDQMAQFRKRYRQIDVLLVDDIQFLEGKERTQEEFFHTFNALREGGRQIVLSSDRPPKALTQLEERLRSRFEWGMIADVQAPDLETRLAILRKKCELDKMQVSDDVLEYIASVFTSNIRELEGALIRANAYASLTGTTLTPATAAGVLNPGGPAKAKPVLTLEQIMDAVASYYHLESSELKSSRRSQDLTLPRHIAMYLANRLLQLSFPRIGAAFGNRKHTSAIYAINKVQELISTTPEVAQAVKDITRRLDG